MCGPGCPQPWVPTRVSRRAASPARPTRSHSCGIWNIILVGFSLGRRRLGVRKPGCEFKNPTPRGPCSLPEGRGHFLVPSASLSVKWGDGTYPLAVRTGQIMHLSTSSTICGTWWELNKNQLGLNLNTLSGKMQKPKQKVSSSQQLSVE